MNRLFASLLLASAPALAGAVEPAAPATNRPVVFQLSADGEWLGAVQAESDPAGAGWVIAPRVPAPGNGMPLTIGGLFSLPAGDGTRVGLGAQQQQQWVPGLAVVPAPAAWCQGIVGMMADTPECSAQGIAGLSLQPVLTRQQGVASVSGRDWDLALGLSSASGWSAGSGLWTAVGPGRIGSGPLLADPGGWTENHEFTVSSQWRLAPWGGLSLSASVGDGRWQMVPGTAPLALDQAAVQVGLFRGPFSGGITGRVLRPTGNLEAPGNLWGGLDIGFAWRTPWRGELSIGARNVVGGSRQPLPAPAAPAIDEATARTPYVRYTQDL
jgi:hypothetical protein